MAENQHKSLYSVVNYLKGLIDSQLANKRFWMKAEISNIGTKSGHYYLDLVEHKEGKIIAQCRACIWSYSIPDIKNNLGDDFQNILKKGAEVLIYVDVRFNEVFGLQLVISGVDRSYALGELEKRKRETYERLRNDGLLEVNKQLKLPTVLQKLAVIGSPNTSGHTDLLKQLNGNEFGYRYDVTQFPCSVQGERAEAEIIGQLKKLAKGAFDAVIMVRGGGSKLDLEVFNSFNIAVEIAGLAIPVLTGIGHETDISIVDLTAHQHFKTPSAVGAFIVAKSREYEVRVQNLYNNIRKSYDSLIQIQKHRQQQSLLSFKTSSMSYTQLRRGSLHTAANRIFTIVRSNVASANSFHNKAIQTLDAVCTSSIATRQNRLNEIAAMCEVKSRQHLVSSQRHITHQQELLTLYANGLLKKEGELLRHATEVIGAFHPDSTLARGYAIARSNGKIIDNTIKLSTGDGIEIELVDRKIRAAVISESPKISKWKTLLTKVLQKS